MSLIEDPLQRELYGSLRSAGYRLWETPDGWQFAYGVERLADDKYASAVLVPVGLGARSGKVTRREVRRELHHVLRRGAKARALRLFTSHSRELEAKNAVAKGARVQPRTPSQDLGDEPKA